MKSSLTKRWPGESLEHSSDTVGAAVFVESKPCCTTLDHLKFFCEMISVRVPYGTTVLQKWPDKRLVGVSFHFWIVDVEVATKKTQSVICFGDNSIHMIISAEIVGHSQAKIFHTIDML